MTGWGPRVVCLALVSACAFHRGASPAGAGDGSAGSNGAGSDGNDGSAACASWALHVDTCQLPAPPSTDLTIGTNSFDTGTGMFGQPLGSTAYVVATVPQLGGGPDATALIVHSLGVTGTLTVTGTKPFMIISDTTISISGTIDAGSHRSNGSLGPGANGTPCNAASKGSNNGDGGGGGGGGFASPGMVGGTGHSGGTGGGGASALGVTPAFLRAGCAGADGGGDAGMQGAGGGALELAARMSISIDGKLTAGGMGGEGGSHNNNNGGGGGGGSGGMIFLDSPTITIASTGVLAANGGGGGGGGESSGAGPGGDGSASTTAAAGGAPNGQGGRGGSGAAGSAPATVGGSVSGSGGGGGGGGAGAGFVCAHTSTLTNSGAVSPSLTAL